MTRTHHHRRFHLPKPNAANEGPEGWLQYGRKVQVTRCLTDCPIILQPKQQDGHAHNWLLCFMTIFIVVVTGLRRQGNYEDLVKYYAEEEGIYEYVPVLLAIMEVETKGERDDVMQREQ